MVIRMTDVAKVVIYKSPIQGGLSEDNAIAWESLANDLRASGDEVTRSDAYMKPGRRGIIFGEVILIAIGWKLLDAATDHAVDAAIDRIVETAKRWGRERFSQRGGERKRPTSIQIVDEDGHSIASWKIDADGEHETRANPEENVDAEAPQQIAPPPWRIESAEASQGELSALNSIPSEVDPAVWVMVRLHDCDDDGCLFDLDVFVGTEHRYRAKDLWSLPKRFVVTPASGSPTPFALEEADDQPLGVRLAAPGWRCQVHEIDSERHLFLCNPE